MYALLSRIDNGLEPLRLKFEEHVKASGLNAVSKILGEGGVDALVRPTSGFALQHQLETFPHTCKPLQEPRTYVDALLEVHKKNADTVQRSFKGEAGFVASLDRACKEFVNKNAATGTSTSKSPELLAKHADALLRKNNKLAEESDLEDALNQVVSLLS